MIALSIYVMVTVSGYPKANIAQGYGPGIYPMLLAGVIMLCAIVVLIKTVIDKKPTEMIADLSLQALKKPAIFWLLLLGFCLLLKPLGLIVDGILYLFIGTKFVFKEKLIPSLIISVVVTMLIWAVFVVAMRVPFPSGTLWTTFGLGG